MEIRPYLIVPKLIPQPTWGGNYIAEFKNIDPSLYGNALIGQSYELSEESALSSELDSSTLPIEIGDPKNGSTQQVIGSSSSLSSIQELISEDPKMILGEKALAQMGKKMNVLIKFTQAKGNSFQVHVVPGKEFGHWKPKPESWYYFEKGRATVGLKADTDLEAYKKVCKEIEMEMQRQSESVKTGKKKIEQAKKEIQEFLMTHSPFLFVNIVDVPKGALIDLSKGGMHHSWEEGPDIPNGNILYEVQVNVMDNECTLRSFDKGKIGDDGSIRPVHIDDYFNALDTQASHNDPSSVLQSVQLHSDTQVSSSMLFDSPYYKTELIEISNTYSGDKTSPAKDKSFHHLFIQEGEAEIVTETVTLRLHKGASVFIPAGVSMYTARTSTKTTILKTFI